MSLLSNILTVIGIADVIALTISGLALLIAIPASLFALISIKQNAIKLNIYARHDELSQNRIELTLHNTSKSDCSILNVAVIVNKQRYTVMQHTHTRGIVFIEEPYGNFKLNSRDVKQSSVYINGLTTIPFPSKLKFKIDVGNKIITKTVPVIITQCEADTLKE